MRLEIVYGGGGSPVAYGLSFLDVGKIVKAIPRPQLRSVASDTWRDNYIDK